MRGVWVGLSCLVALVVGMVSPAVAQERGGSAPVLVAQVRDQPVKLAVYFWVPGAAYILNPGTAERLNLRHKWLMSFGADVAGEKLKGSTQQITTQIMGQKLKGQRAVWFPKDFVSNADGVIGVGAIPVDNLWLDYGVPKRGEPTFVVPLEERWGMWGTRVSVGDAKFRVVLGFERAETRTNWGAGKALLATAQAEQTGVVKDAELAFGVMRPIERLDITDLSVGGRPVANVWTRIPPARARELEREVEDIDDPDEADVVVVTADADADDDERRPMIALGRDWLGSCTTVRLMKSAELLEVYC